MLNDRIRSKVCRISAQNMYYENMKSAVLIPGGLFSAHSHCEADLQLHVLLHCMFGAILLLG